MKKLLLISAALCLLATSAFASGIDLVVTACPGVAGSSNDAGTLDCAGGATLVLLGVFQPAEAISDLVAADAILDFTVGDEAGVIAGADNFWDLESTNSAALNGAPARPTTGCSTYNNAFGVANSGFAAAAAVQKPYRVRVATTSYRPSNLNATLNQKIFAFQLLLDLSTSAEAGGTATGCLSKVAFALEQIIPGSAANIPVTTLTTGATGANTNVVLANTANQPVPAVRHSWGQLKNLYR